MQEEAALPYSWSQEAGLSRMVTNTAGPETPTRWQELEYSYEKE